MGAKLDALHELQDVELQIVDIRRQLARKERAVKAQDRRLASARQVVEAEREELRRSQMRVDELDLDLKGRTANINRLREHLNTVRTNKDYAAVLAQLNTEKADANRLEGRALEMMGGIDSKRSELSDQEQVEQDESGKLEEVSAQLEQARRSFAERLSELQRRRAEISERIDARVCKIFSRVSERYDGEVLVKLIRTHPRRDEFVCAGCNMSVTAERVSAAMTRDDVQTCPNCGRLIYFDRAS